MAILKRRRRRHPLAPQPAARITKQFDVKYAFRIDRHAEGRKLHGRRRADAGVYLLGGEIRSAKER